jgi:K+-sensing histidine kinase KdpD
MQNRLQGLVSNWLRTPITASLPVIGLSLFLVAVLTAALVVLSLFTGLGHVTIIYLIPVMVAAIRGGVLPAVIAAVAGIVAAAFFFYPPIYNVRVYDPVQIIDIVLFIFVAVVTGHLAANLQRAHLREQAAALREAVIGSVSHELRTPLSAILGSASVLASSEVAQNPQLKPLLSGLREEAERLDDHIQALLDAMRISSEGIQPRSEWVDPGDIANTAVERRGRLLMGRKLSLTVADNLPMVQVDAVLIERALGHLIENAVKYSPPTSPIDVQVEQVGRFVRFTVRDEGVGLSAEEQDHIWERFYRSPRHAKIGGAGLGLWIARALVNACGGKVEASSPGIGQGTSLAILLPFPRRIDHEHLKAIDDD